jgi:diguanylate cyclase
MERGRTFVVATVAFALITVLFLVWMVIVIGGPRLTDAVDDLGELVAALVAAAACGLAASRMTSGRACWVLLGASSLAWGAGEAAWSYYDLVSGVAVPFPSLADVGFLTSVPLAVAGLLLFPSSPRRVADRIQGILDGCIIAGSLLFASWVTVLQPLYNTHSGGALAQTLSLAYPASDVVMVSLVIILFARAGQKGRASLGLVMAGLVAFAIADSAFSYMTEVHSYGTGTFLDAGWVAGYLLVALGALRAVYVPSTMSEARVTTLSLVAPYVPVLAVLVVTAVELLLGHRMGTVGWIMVFALAVLVLGRQLLSLLDQAARRRHLEAAADGSGEARAELDPYPVLLGH